MRIAQEMFDPIPLDDDPVLDETLRPFGRDHVGGLVRALEADQVSVRDRVQIESLVEKIKAGAYAVDPLPIDDQPDYGSPYRMLKIFAEKYANAPASAILAKRAKIDASQLRVGMAVKCCDGKIGKIKELNGAAVVIDYDGGSAVIITKIGVQEEIIRSLRHGIRAKQPRIIKLWGTIRSEDAAERTNAPLRDIESLKAKGEAIVSNLEARLSRAIGDDLAEYRRVREQLAVHVNTAHFGVFPIPPAAQAANAAQKELNEKLTPILERLPGRIFSAVVNDGTDE